MSICISNCSELRACSNDIVIEKEISIGSTRAIVTRVLSGEYRQGNVGILECHLYIYIYIYIYIYTSMCEGYRRNCVNSPEIISREKLSSIPKIGVEIIVDLSEEISEYLEISISRFAKRYPFTIIMPMTSQRTWDLCTQRAVYQTFQQFQRYIKVHLRASQGSVLATPIFVSTSRRTSIFV